MKRIALCISIVLIILSNLYNIEAKKVEENLSYKEYTEELGKNYGDDKKKILDKINEEISNNKNSKEYIGINLLVRQQYFYLWGENKNFIKYAKETENYLKKYNMEDELLHLYSIMSSRYIGNEQYNEAYIYIHKGEYLAKNLYEKNESKETLSTLIAIKYLKAKIALDIGMESNAEIVFNEAEELRKEGIRERVDIYSNILLYYQEKKEYALVEEYALKVIRLVEEIDPEIKNYEGAYIRAKIILGENYIYIGEINKSIEIANELSNDKSIFSRNIRRYEIYYLYGQIYKYYGSSQKYIKYLKMAYDEVKNTEMSSKKIKVVELIIEELELMDNKEELLRWHKIKSEIFRNRESSVDTQYLLSQLIDTDLENAKYNIEILQLQKSKMIYFIIALSLMITIIVIIVIVENKRKKLLKENINILEKNIIIKQQYYENIKINHENIKRIKHDIKNHIIAINKLMLEKQYEKATKYIDCIDKNIDYSNLDIATNNKVIDAIVSSKMETCNLENIYMDLDINIPKEIPLEEFDICVIYGNLIDNAIEACRKIDEYKSNKYIKLKNFIKGDYLFINIKNSYSENINMKSGNFITSKKDKINHGIGIENIKKSVKKYDGDIKIDYTEDEFQVSIIINIAK